MENNKIYYTTTDNRVINVFNKNAFGKATIISNTYKNGQGVITFNKAITFIGESAFSYCESLISITIPNSITSIREYAFSYCKNLTSIKIPNSITSIGEYAFSHCKNLTSIKIPNSITSIGEYAFSYLQK